MENTITIHTIATQFWLSPRCHRLGVRPVHTIRKRLAVVSWTRTWDLLSLLFLYKALDVEKHELKLLVVN